MVTQSTFSNCTFPNFPQYASTGVLLTKRIVAGLETLPVYDFRILAFSYITQESSLALVAFTDIILPEENNRYAFLYCPFPPVYLAFCYSLMVLSVTIGAVFLPMTFQLADGGGMEAGSSVVETL